MNTALPYEHNNSTRSAQTQEHYSCYLLECHAAEGALDLLLSSITPHPEHLVRVPPLRHGAGSSRRLPLNDPNWEGVRELTAILESSGKWGGLGSGSEGQDQRRRAAAP